jgi:hypothetical protein
MTKPMDKISAKERFEGYIIARAIGDVLGSVYENQEPLLGRHTCLGERPWKMALLLPESF